MTTKAAKQFTMQVWRDTSECVTLVVTAHDEHEAALKAKLAAYTTPGTEWRRALSLQPPQAWTAIDVTEDESPI